MQRWLDMQSGGSKQERFPVAFLSGSECNLKCSVVVIYGRNMSIFSATNSKALNSMGQNDLVLACLT